MTMPSPTHAALFIAATLATSGCFGVLGGLTKTIADSRTFDTGLANPGATETFLRGATRLGCKNELSASGDLWTVCPGATFGLKERSITWGHVERAATLTIGCAPSDAAHCDAPIAAILDAGQAPAAP